MRRRHRRALPIHSWHLRTCCLLLEPLEVEDLVVLDLDCMEVVDLQELRDKLLASVASTIKTVFRDAIWGWLTTLFDRYRPAVAWLSWLRRVSWVVGLRCHVYLRRKKPSLSKMHSINTKGNLATNHTTFKRNLTISRKRKLKTLSLPFKYAIVSGKKVRLSYAIYILHERLENTLGNRIAQRYIHYVGAATLLEPRSKCKSQEESICRLNHSLPLDLIWKILHSWNRLT